MSELFESVELAVSAEGAGARLDTYAASAAELSRNAVQRMIEEGEILLNGRTAKPKDRLREGDVISVTIQPPAVTDIVPQNIPIDIVYQDEDIAVINKPKGMVVHPAAGKSRRHACECHNVPYKGSVRHRRRGSSRNRTQDRPYDERTSCHSQE